MEGRGHEPRPSPRLRARQDQARRPDAERPQKRGTVVIGTVYLLHFDPGRRITGNRVARHYIGWTEGDVDTRLAQHLAGRGSPLVAAVAAAGGTVSLARTWDRVDRHFERRLKNRHEAPRLCPQCVASGRTNGRGLLAQRRRRETRTSAGQRAAAVRTPRGRASSARLASRGARRHVPAAAGGLGAGGASRRRRRRAPTSRRTSYPRPRDAAIARPQPPTHSNSSSTSAARRAIASAQAETQSTTKGGPHGSKPQPRRARAACRARAPWRVARHEGDARARDPARCSQTPRGLPNATGGPMMHRMRCLRCRRPWAATSAAERTCPFCGNRDVLSSIEVLARALERDGRPGWLHGRRAS